MLLSDVDQLRAEPDDADSSLASVTSAEVKALIGSGAARDGMRPKMIAALDALDSGAQRIVMANGTRPHALRDALTSSIPTTEVVRVTRHFITIEQQSTSDLDSIYELACSRRSTTRP